MYHHDSDRDRQRFRRRWVLAYNGVISMLRANAMMAPLSKDFRVLANHTTKPTASSVSATNVTIEPPVIESTQRHNRVSDPPWGVRKSQSWLACPMDALLYLIAACLIAAGVFASAMPALPGIPLVFGGIWMIAAVDHYHRLGVGWLLGIAFVGLVGLSLDLLAGALGAKRAGASPRAVFGTLLGTVAGLFFGLPGLLLGPFLGAVAGELSAGRSMLRSTQVGISTWIGLIFGTIMKLVSSVTMVALLGAAWWWNSGPS
jgi:uncharacterized protein